MGIIWNKHIQASPITDLKSDRFCAVKVSLLNASTMSLISVYLPSTDHPLDEFEEYLNELVFVYIALQAEGPVVLLGDFNAHPNHPMNHQGSLLHDAITHSDLPVPSTSCTSTGSRNTFFSGLNRTVVDYILMDASLCNCVENCLTHQHHYINFLPSPNLNIYQWQGCKRSTNTITTEKQLRMTHSMTTYRMSLHIFNPYLQLSFKPLLS